MAPSGARALAEQPPRARAAVRPVGARHPGAVLVRGGVGAVSEAAWELTWARQVILSSSMSTCLTRQVGAIVVRDKRLIASGFNGTVARAAHCNEGGCDRCARRYAEKALVKYGKGLGALIPTEPTVGSAGSLHECVCVHAEINAIGQCARYGSPTLGARMYCTTKPCLDCAKAAAAAGITEIVWLDDYPVEYPAVIRLRRFRTDVRVAVEDLPRYRRA